MAETQPGPPEGHRNLAIHHDSDGSVVALVEVASPEHKARPSTFQAMLARLDHAPRSGAHVLLIDVHPPGPSGPQGVHRALIPGRPGHPYQHPPDQPLVAYSFQVGDGIEAFVEPFAVGDVLPAMPLFLTSGFYVILPLEPCYQAAFLDVPPRYRRAVEAEGD
jgi:hypothetical protein